jgi:serine/threonine-protein kinase
MSPEQARGEDATAQSDLYALGILFFEMVTGQLPFRSNDRETLLEMQRSAPAPRPRQLRADLPPAAENIILKLLEKDARKRFRDGHHLQEELKAFQRSLPQSPWDMPSATQEQQVVAPPPPPSATPHVVEWGTRAAHYARMVARAYPNGKAPADVQQAADKCWELAARASRLEGELTSHSRKLEAIERRGRALRAEIGRKVEELAAEESRTLREAQAEREEAERVNTSQRQAERRATEAAGKADQTARDVRDVPSLRRVFEEAGAARAQVEELARLSQRHDGRAHMREEAAKDLRRQIDELRAQLSRYGDALENDLAAGRERIATRVKEALGYEQAFASATHLLLTHLKGRPECRELIEELEASTSKSMLSKLAAQSLHINAS